MGWNKKIPRVAAKFARAVSGAADCAIIETKLIKCVDSYEKTKR